MSAETKCGSDCMARYEPFIILSTQHGPTAETSVRRKKGDGSIVDVRCPQAIVDYNCHMGGIVLRDQYRATIRYE